MDSQGRPYTSSGQKHFQVKVQLHILLTSYADILEIVLKSGLGSIGSELHRVFLKNGDFWAP